MNKLRRSDYGEIWKYKLLKPWQLARLSWLSSGQGVQVSDTTGVQSGAKAGVKSLNNLHHNDCSN
ncbi:MAG TPA: hypothetical protein VFN95_07430 [Flavitalea sp.]|nr:hypothetical protein [Flavitalea sp.]